MNQNEERLYFLCLSYTLQFSARVLFPHNSEMTVVNISASRESTWKRSRKTQLSSDQSACSKLLGIPQVSAKSFSDTKLEK